MLLYYDYLNWKCDNSINIKSNVLQLLRSPVIFDIMSYWRTINCTKYNNNSNTWDRGPSPSIQLHTDACRWLEVKRFVGRSASPFIHPGGGSPVLDPVRTFCFWDETRETLQPSTCFVKFFQMAFSSQILFLLTSFCLSVRTLFLIAHLMSAISLLIFKISLSTSLREGIIHPGTFKTSKEVTRQGVIFNLPKP